MKIWIVSGVSESSDHYGPLAFSKKPSQKKLKALCLDWDPPEYDEEGPGDFGTYINLTVKEVEVDENGENTRK